jgi:tRNA(Ile)-lysidine synthase
MHAFESQLSAAWPPADWLDLTVVVAVSGGADSVALLRGLLALKTGGAGRLVVAHFNHHLRPSSDADQAQVESLCRTWNLKCHCGSGPVSEAARQRGDGIEEAARSLRYDFLLQVACEEGARYVATAHTADDQAETLLQRIFRGTGIAGLSGVPRVRSLDPAVTLIRPLLAMRRSLVLDYLQSLDQSYCEDPSNRDLRYRRNWIRHALLPRVVEAYDPHVIDSLLRLSRLSGEAQSVFDALVATLLDQAVEVRDDRVEIEVSALRETVSYLRRELLIAIWKQQGWPLQAMGLDQWEQLAQMLDASLPEDMASKRMFPGTVVAERSASCLVLWRDQDPG